jgi:hypothetical protein
LLLPTGSGGGGAAAAAAAGTVASAPPVMLPVAILVRLAAALEVSVLQLAGAASAVKG